MLLHEGLTHIHSQIKPKLLVGESFTLRAFGQFLDRYWPITERLASVVNSGGSTRGPTGASAPIKISLALAVALL